MACFVAGHLAIFKNDLNNVDVVFRKLLRSVVGPPAATDWSRPWHEILHDWNARVAQIVQQCSVKCWSVRCVEMHWNLAQYAANLPPDRWLSRILMWTCRDITMLVVLETLGTLRYRTFAGISIWATGEPWQRMGTGGQI